MPNPAGGSSLHPGQQKELREDNPTFLAGYGTAVQQQSRFVMEIPPRISAAPTTPSPASKQEPSPSWGQASSPPHTQALTAKGMNRSTSCFPNHTKCSRDAGRTGELTPNISCTTQSNLALSHSPIPRAAWRKNRRNQPQSPRGSWKSSFPHQASTPQSEQRKANSTEAVRPS